MNLLENIKEAIRSVKSNLLRTILTGLIIAIGITSVVAMLTAIDGMKAQIEERDAALSHYQSGEKADMPDTAEADQTIAQVDEETSAVSDEPQKRSAATR